MSRIRTVKPSFWKHEDLSALPEPTHMLAAALLNYADDEGYFNANPGLIRGECSPLREPSVSIPVSLQHLSKVGYLRLGTGADGKRYGQIVKFSEHQVVNKKTPSKIKTLGITWDVSGSSPVVVNEPSLLEGNKEEEGNKEGNKEKEQGEGRSQARAAPEVDSGALLEIPPRLDRTKRALRLRDDWTLSQDWRIEAANACLRHRKQIPDLDLEATKFANHWHAKSGKDATKLDWRATWINWVLKADEHRKPNGSDRPGRLQSSLKALAEAAGMGAERSGELRGSPPALSGPADGGGAREGVLDGLPPGPSRVGS